MLQKNITQFNLSSTSATHIVTHGSLDTLLFTLEGVTTPHDDLQKVHNKEKTTTHCDVRCEGQLTHKRPVTQTTDYMTTTSVTSTLTTKGDILPAHTTPWWCGTMRLSMPYD